VDAARRICDEYQILVSELWSFATAFDQVRFTLVHKSPDAPTVRVPAAAPERSRPAKPAAKASPKPAAKAKLKPKAKAKPAAKKAAKKAKPAPRKGATLRQAQGRPERSRGTKKRR
jgi:hypothetical protein